MDDIGMLSVPKTNTDNRCQSVMRISKTGKKMLPQAHNNLCLALLGTPHALCTLVFIKIQLCEQKNAICTLVYIKEHGGY